MDKTERLLDLIALLLDAEKPVPWLALREAFPDAYGGSDEAALRKFERDKAELVELGLPLTFVPSPDEEASGYLVDRTQYYLPDVGLTPDELALLYSAGSAALRSRAFPGQRDLEHALRKLSFFSDAQLAAPRLRFEVAGTSPELAERLEAIWAAIGAKKRVTIEYASPRAEAPTVRDVDPYGLALKRGMWWLVGWCHLRQAVRTFAVHRVRSLTVNAARPKSPDFTLPADFRIEAHVATWPWQHRFHAPVQVRLAAQGPLKSRLGALFPTARLEAEGHEAVLEATDLLGLARYVLSLGPTVRVVAPEEAVATYRRQAEAIMQAHRPSEIAPC